MMDIERLAFDHIQRHHLTDGEYEPLLEWSTPVEEVAQMRSRGICTHLPKEIYNA